MRLFNRLAFKIVALAVFLVVVTIVYFAGISFVREHTALEQKFGTALQHIVATAALQIDGDAHRYILEPRDAQGSAFRHLRSYLEKVQQANGLHPDLLYTFNIVSESELRFAVMLHQTPFTGNVYKVVPQNLEAVRRTIRSGQPSFTRLYTDPHGEWVSAYAPIRDGRGEVVGILEADYEVTEFTRALHAELRWLLLASLSAVALAVALSFLLARQISRALHEIRKGAEAIEHEDYFHRIRLDRKDELGLVARQFNRTAEVLLERFHMLKFLPRHTLDAITRRALRGDGFETERIEATIFFSDIRGYTAMSTGLSDEQIVRMLNTYLRRQAEILEVYDGTIDKFIGDAVVAVFTGARHELRAVEAAAAIQAEIAAMNERGAFERPVHVGIGLASGSLVLGEVGSEERRERTIIGSVVNLASRLCSQAGAGEIVVSEALRAALGGALPVSGSRNVELKGFPGEQLCHVLGAPRAALRIGSGVPLH